MTVGPRSCSHVLGPLISLSIRRWHFCNDTLVRRSHLLKRVLIPICRLWLLFPVFCVGCGPNSDDLPKTVSASGIVTLDGQPVDGAQVVFIDDTSNKSADAMTDSQGKFMLNAFREKKGAQPGTYKVQVSKTIEQKLGTKNADGGDDSKWIFGVPAEYSSYLKSGLTATIPESGTSDLKIELTSGKK